MELFARLGVRPILRIKDKNGSSYFSPSRSHITEKRTTQPEDKQKKNNLLVSVLGILSRFDQALERLPFYRGRGAKQR